MGAPYGAAVSSMSQGGVPGGGVVKLKKQIPSVECKFFDTNWNPTITTISLWSQVDLINILCGIIQGAGPSQRVGRKIKEVGQGVVIRGAFVATAAGSSASGPSSIWSMDVIRDKQCNGAVPTAADIYTIPTDFVGAVLNQV
jgi:hypothetical protein